MDFENYKFSVLDRFLKYVKFDTQSDETSSTRPSTEKQIIFIKELKKELEELGLVDISEGSAGELYALLPSNTEKNTPSIGFIAHVDTSPANSGKDVKPILHKKFRGNELTLPKEGTKINLDSFDDWKTFYQKTIITSDGSTLLGGDDKAGVAEIMDSLNYLVANKEVKHGNIYVAFTMDEEIGKGMDYFDTDKFKADFAYTVDGGVPGSIGIDNFNADKHIITFFGKDIHPGYGKGKLVNSLKITTEFMKLLSEELPSPEQTSKREGFVHPIKMEGGVSETKIHILARSFEEDELNSFKEKIRFLAKKTCKTFPGSSFDIEHIEQYKNMTLAIKSHPLGERGVNYISKALENIGLSPIIKPTRGGTDGSKLSFKGIPCPNIFAGERNFHSKSEFIIAEDMELAVRNILEIISLWNKDKEYVTIAR